MKAYLLLLLAAALLVAVGCSKEQKTTTGKGGEGATTQPAQGLGAEPGTLAEQKKEYRQSLQVRLDTIDANISDLRSRAANATGQNKQMLNDSITELQQKRTAVQNEMKDVDNATSDTWSDVKGRLDKSMDDLEKAYNSTLEKMKTDTTGGGTTTAPSGGGTTTAPSDGTTTAPSVG